MGKRLYTHSSSKSFRACMYQYYVLYILGYRSVKTAMALFFGTLIHGALEAYWLARKANQQADRTTASAPDGSTIVRIDPLEAALAAIPNNINPFDRAKARVMVTAYAAVWNQVNCEVIAVEAKFVTPLLDPTTMKASEYFDRAGKIDLVIKLEDGRIAVVEHKTSALDVGPGSDYRRRLALDEQVSFYYAGAISLGFKPDTIIYDVLKKFREKPKLATPDDKRVMVTDRKTKERRLKSGQRENNETPDEFERRLATEVAKDPEKYIERIGIQRLPHERKKFALEVWNQSRLMVYALDNGLFPKNSDACFKYGVPCSLASHCYENVPLADTTTFRKLGDLHPELQEAHEDEPEEAA